MSETEPIGRLIYRTTMTLKNYLEQRLRPYDLTVEQYQVLKSLSEENGLVQGRLCELVFKSPANMTRILDRLAKKNCIERKENPDDRRSSRVFLTPEGEALLLRVVSEYYDCEPQIVQGIDPVHLDIMRSGLNRICANLTELREEEK